MTTKFRKNVFETNSSSSHSLTMSASDVLDVPFAKAQLRAGVVSVGLGRYYHEWHRFYAPLAKIEYLLTQALYIDDEVVLPALADGQDDADFTQQICAENKKAAMLVDVVRELTGCALWFTPEAEGDIDHESVGVGCELFEDAQALTKFIFASDSFVQTGNDNNRPGKFIDTDRGPEEFYSHGYREAGPQWVPLVLTSSTNWQWLAALGTEQGAVLSRTHHADVYSALQSQATVVAAHWDSKNQWAKFAAVPEPEGHVMADLIEGGFKFIADLAVTEDFTEESWENQSTTVTLSFLVPADLAQAISQLPATATQP